MTPWKLYEVYTQPYGEPTFIVAQSYAEAVKTMDKAYPCCTISRIDERGRCYLQEEQP